MSDSKYLYCFCSTQLKWITRKAPFGNANLKDEDLSINFAAETKANDIVTVIATEALTDNETWLAMKEGELTIFEKGELLFQALFVE